MKFLYTALLFLLLSQSSFARNHLLFLDTSLAVKDYSIFDKTIVVDALMPDKSNEDSIVSWTHATDKNKDAIEEIFSNYAELVTRNIRKENRTLLIVVNDLVVKELYKPSQSSAMLNADIFLGDQGKYKRCFQFVAYKELYDNYKGTALNHVVSELIFKVVDSAAHLESTSSKSSDTLYSYEEAIALRRHQVKSLPIFSAKQFNDGVFKTADDFLNLRPDSLDFLVRDGFQTTTQTVVPDVFRRLENGRKGKAVPRDSFFAVCFNGKLYVSALKGMRRMRGEAGAFYTTLLFPKPVYSRKGDGAIMSAGIAFGLVGALTAAIIVSATVDRTPYDTGDRVLVPYNCKFDLIKKKFIPVEKLTSMDGR